MIEVKQISVAIGTVQILSDVSASAGRSQIVTVVGANGAGKSTLLRTISNIVPASAGTVEFEGRSTRGIPPHRLAQAGLVHVPQGRQIIPNLSVEENLLIGARNVAGMRRPEVEETLQEEFARFPVLRERRHLAGGSLSGGEQQMLAISRALMMRPKVLMLDEPSLGLAPKLVAEIMRALSALREKGLAIVLVEQMAMAALKIADFAYVLRNGRVVVAQEAASLRKDPALIESYL